MMLLHEVFPYAQDTPALRAGVPATDGRTWSVPAAIPRTSAESSNRRPRPSGTGVAEADRRDGRREPKPAAVDAVLTSTERDELARLRRENKQLRLEREILSRAAAWFARETGVVPPGSSHS